MIFDNWILPEPISDLPLPTSHPALRSILIRRGITTDDEFVEFLTLPGYDELN